MNKEINWKPIHNHPKYEISSTGIIRRCIGKKELKLHTHKKGYLIVSLFEGGNMVRRSVHSLMCETFIDENYRRKGLVVVHKNGNNNDNNIYNLELTTPRLKSYERNIKGYNGNAGVWKKQDSNEFNVVFRVERRNIYFGTFEEESPAIELSKEVFRVLSYLEKHNLGYELLFKKFTNAKKMTYEYKI